MAARQANNGGHPEQRNAVLPHSITAGGGKVAAAEILTRLHKVKQVGPSKWVARCPAHPDRNPSLSIKEAPDGRVLLYCFAGCPTEAILAALGLNWSDLFPERQEHRRQLSRRERQEVARRRAGVILERAYQRAVAETISKLGDLIRHVEGLLWRCGGWEIIMADGSGADYLAKLAHQLSWWEYLWEELFNSEAPSPEILRQAKEVIRKWQA